jgi:hypothetical protein
LTYAFASGGWHWYFSATAAIFGTTGQVIKAGTAIWRKTCHPGESKFGEYGNSCAIAAADGGSGGVAVRLQHPPNYINLPGYFDLTQEWIYVSNTASYPGENPKDIKLYLSLSPITSSTPISSI